MAEPRIYKARSIGPSTWRFTVNGGEVTGFLVDVEVNFGAMGQMETVDIWPNLNSQQKATVQGIYARVLGLVQREILGDR